MLQMQHRSPPHSRKRVATIGVLLALQARAQYGMGQALEVSLLDAMIALQSMESTVFLNSGTLPPKSGSGHWMIPQPYGVYHTQDHPLVLNAHSDDWWARLCKAAEFAHLASDPRYCTRAIREHHSAELAADLQAIFTTRRRDEWLAHLGQYDVLCAPVYNYAELFADPQVQHNEMVVEQHHPSAGPIKVIGLPVKLSATPGQVGSPAPRLGEHTRDILQWLGYDAAQIERLRQDNVVSQLGD